MCSDKLAKLIKSVAGPMAQISIIELLERSRLGRPTQLLQSIGLIRLSRPINLIRLVELISLTDLMRLGSRANQLHDSQTGCVYETY